MVKKILLATDGSTYAADACRLLAGLPWPVGTEIQVICVVDTFVEGLLAAVQPNQRGQATRFTETAAESLRRDGIQVTTSLRSGDAAHQVIQAAEEWNADLVVIGSKGLTGLEGFVLGSVANNVAKHAPCPVLVARATDGALQTVLVATDGSSHAHQAVEFASDLPLPTPTEFVIVHVVRTPHPLVDLTSLGEKSFQGALQEDQQAQRRRGEELLAGTASFLGKHGRKATVEVRSGDPAEQIVAVADGARAELIVLAARGTSLIQSLLVGSVADRVLQQARGSVLIVR